MPTIDAPPFTPTLARGWLFTLMNVVHNAREAVRSYRQRRSTYRELAALDTQALHDMGITRDDIGAVADGRFTRDGSRYRQRKILSFHYTAAPTSWAQRQRPGIRSQSGQSALSR